MSNYDLATGINVKDVKRGAEFVSSLKRGCSFSQETPVATTEGLKPIGELKVGQEVLARSETTGATGFKPITQVFKHHDPVKLHLTLEDPATRAVERIVTTPEHPFHVPGRGFVDAAALKPGDPVSRAPSAEPAKPLSTVSLTADLSDTSGALRVKALTLEDQPFWAYNLEVNDFRTYFVGKTKAWVHNSGPCERFRQGTVGELREAGVKDAHHVIQDAAVRDLPGYDTNAAHGIHLPGPSNAPGTPHYAATVQQRRAGGGTYAAERRIGYRAMRRAGVPRAEARAAIGRADEYFGSIGVKPDTATRPVGNRSR